MLARISMVLHFMFEDVWGAKSLMLSIADNKIFVLVFRKEKHNSLVT